MEKSNENAVAEKENSGTVFGDIKSIPKPVATNKLTSFSPKKEDGDYIPFDEVKEDLFTDDLKEFNNDFESMFSGTVGDELDEKIKRVEEAAEEAKTESGFEEAGNDGFSLNDLDAEMIFEMIENGRITLHDQIYNYFIYKHPKEAKKIARELAMKDQKTDKEKNLLKKLYDFIDKHDACKNDYLTSAKYGERHRELLIKFIEYNIKKAAVKGKRLTVRTMWFYMLGMEAAPFLALWRISGELPEFRIDSEMG